MSADIYVESCEKAGLEPVLLHDDGYYWFLYAYFEKANLARQDGELIDLYDNAEIEGYQLDRLRDELLEAEFDAKARTCHMAGANRLDRRNRLAPCRATRRCGTRADAQVDFAAPGAN